MRPLEQYPTLQRGRAVMRRQEEDAWNERIARLRKSRRKLAHWLSIRLVRWGYRLEQYATFGEMSS